MMKYYICLLLLSITLCGVAQERTTIMIPGRDGIPVFADPYFVDSPPKYSVILLCHQAGFSRGEYRRIAPRLNGYSMNAIAIDQRSGGTVMEVRNRTAELATDRKLPTGYLDAQQDIETAIQYIADTYHQKVILWGSSYSASLALLIGRNNPNVEAVVAFSPGEYFGVKYSLRDSIQKLNIPTFVTSAKNEVPALTALVKGIKSVEQYIPTGEGAHGSITLMPNDPNSPEYWRAVTKFIVGLHRK